MSEAERLRRQTYKRNRSRWILIQAIALATVLAIALAGFAVYERMNRTYYIEYTENGSVDYKVFLNDNHYFDKDYVGKDQSYVSSLIKNVSADFMYQLNMDAQNVGFDYTYQIDAQMIIANKDSGDYIYAPEFELVPKTQGSVQSGNTLNIRKNVAIDYNQYNTLAKEFMSAYDLKSATAMLVVTMTVDVLSSCDEFENNSENTYFVSLNIPLNQENFSMYSSSSTTDGQSKVLACSGAINQNIFLILAIVLLSLAVLQAAFLTVFIYITRNEDVNYTNKVRKLVSQYRSFIQQMEGEFDTEGYQIVPIKTFTEMLGIRDTIQSPILMFENLDQTMTEFVIPTNTKILYAFTIKVENYDDIYSTAEQPAEEPIDEIVLLDDTVSNEDIEEAMTQPDVILDEVNFVQDDDEELEQGVEVIGVVWPERAHKNKVYRYDPNGEELHEGDVVLVPTRDVAKNKEIIRKAAVAHGNHRIDPEHIKHPLKKIIGVIKRNVQKTIEQ